MPGAVVLLAVQRGERPARRGRVARPGVHLHDAASPLAAERVLAGEQRLHLLGGLEGGERLVETGRGPCQQPRGVVDEQLRAGLALRADGAACLLEPRSASANRPSQSRMIAFVPSAAALTGSSAHPWSRASAIACSLSSYATEARCPPSGAAIARCARQPICRYGRPIRRASSSPCCRWRRASPSRDDHSSAIPRFMSAAARRSLLSASSPTGCVASSSSMARIASTAVPTFPRRRASASVASSSCRSKRHLRSAGTVSARRCATAM